MPSRRGEVRERSGGASLHHDLSRTRFVFLSFFLSLVEPVATLMEEILIVLRNNSER